MATEVEPTTGGWIREWRNRLKIGRAEASRRLGVSKRTLEHWEQGHYQPTGALRERVVAVLLGRHDALPDLKDAVRLIQEASQHLERILALPSGAGVDWHLRDRIDLANLHLTSQAKILSELAEQPAAQCRGNLFC